MIRKLLTAHKDYDSGNYRNALHICELIYIEHTSYLDNLLLLGAIHFQLRNFSESLFFHRQCIRVKANSAEAYSNIGNCLKELNDIDSAISFFTKAIRFQPRASEFYINLATAEFQNGNVLKAIDTFQIAISIKSNNLVDAHNNLGIVMRTVGKLEEAKKHFIEAVKIDPKCAIAWSNLGTVFYQQKEINSAIESFQQAVKLEPNFCDAYSNLGNSLWEEGSSHQDEDTIAKALISFQQAIDLRPQFATAHGNLALCYYERGNYDLCCKLLHKAVYLESNYADAFNNLGCTYMKLGNLENGIQNFLRAIRIRADHVYALNNLGIALRKKGMVKEAFHCFAIAMKLKPDFAEPKSNIGVIYLENGFYSTSIKYFQHAIKLNPLFHEIFVNLGNAYKEIGKTDNAWLCFNNVIKCSPCCAEACMNIAAMNLEESKIDNAIEWYKKCQCDEAIIHLVFHLSNICSWVERNNYLGHAINIINKVILNVNTTLSSIQPYYLSIIHNITPAEIHNISKKYARSRESNTVLTRVDSSSFDNAKLKNACIKIGYVSSAFGNHPIGFLTQSLYGLHDRSNFEVYCFSLKESDQSEVWSTISNDADYFEDLSTCKSNEDAMQRIKKCGIHILVNLDGWTKDSLNEIFSVRAAPIQILMMGHCGTMGASYMDYIISDEVIIPQEHRIHFTEKLLCVPNCFLINDHKQSANFILEEDFEEVYDLRLHYGISEDSFVYACFSQPYKIEPELFLVWLQILQEVPNSVFVLIQYNVQSMQNLKQEARKQGVDPQRLIFFDVIPFDKHLKRCRIVDLVLDTRCGCMATGCDVLWCGIPLITLQGNNMNSRVASSLLSALGLQEDLAVLTLEEYKSLAIELNKDADKYMRILRKLEDVRLTSSLFDTKAWVCNYERGLLKVMERYEQGYIPEHIFVS